MSLIHPTRNEIYNYLKIASKIYINHLKHLLRYQWRGTNGIEFRCTYCTNRIIDGIDKMNKRCKADLRGHLQYDNKRIVQGDQSIKTADSKYVIKQLEPVIKNLWLNIEIRNIYKKMARESGLKYYPMYALVKHICRHKEINEFDYFPLDEPSEILGDIKSFNRQQIINRLISLRELKCSDCSALSRKNTILSWCEWQSMKFNKCKLYIKNNKYLCLFRHLGHILFNTYHSRCILCLQFREKANKSIMKI